MLKQFLTLVALASTTAVSTTSALAVGPGEMARGLTAEKSASFIQERGPTLAPFAHVRFCIKNPSECQPGEGYSLVPDGEALQTQLNRVNREVNAEITPVSDRRENDFGDTWKIAISKGDCEDIALAKRKRLISLGWSPRALRIAVTRTPSGEGHAVLVVKTTRGDLVLDNRDNAIRDWKKTDLTWLKIQSEGNPRIWMSI